MKIYLKNNILQDAEISEKAKLVYIALRSLMDNEAIQLFEIEDMLKIVRGKKERKQRAISKIQEGINRLADYGLIKVLNESDKGMKIDVSNLIFQTSKGGFVIIDKAIFSKIKEIETLNYSKAIVYFCILKSTVNSKSKLGKTGIRKLSKYTGYSYSTLIKMNEAFEANGIMCIEKGNQYCANKYSVCEFQPETTKNNKDIEDINADIKDKETVIDTTSEEETDYFSHNPYLD